MEQRVCAPKRAVAAALCRRTPWDIAAIHGGVMLIKGGIPPGCAFFAVVWAFIVFCPSQR
jgi:hypothetical protein